MKVKRPKTFNMVLSVFDEDTGETGVRLLKVQAYTRAQAKAIVHDLRLRCEPWVIKAMSIDGQRYSRAVEVIDTYLSSKHDELCRVWTPEEIDNGDLEELVGEPEPFSIESSAYHEAGHVLVADQVGWDVGSVEVYEERIIDEDGSSTTGGMSTYWPPKDEEDEEDPILISLAGPVAEAMHKNTFFSITAMLGLSSRGSHLGGSGDYEKVSILAKQLHFDEGDEMTDQHNQMMTTYLTYMVQRVRVQYLVPHWDAVERIAKTVLAKEAKNGVKRLDGLEVDRLIEGK
jgi:hypothetical protein